jgi:hypothetical protein
MCLTDTAPDNYAPFAPPDAMVSPVLVSVVTTAQRDGFATVPTIYLDLRATYSRDAVASTLGIPAPGRAHHPDVRPSITNRTNTGPRNRPHPRGPTSHVPDPGQRRRRHRPPRH